MKPLYFCDEWAAPLLAARSWSVNRDGYMRATIKGKYVAQHRYVWFLRHGQWPSGVIHHVNGIKTDNRLENLRDVTVRENLMNRTKKRKHDLPRGVHPTPSGRFQSFIWRNARLDCLGTFDTPDDASKAYEVAASAILRP